MRLGLRGRLVRLGVLLFLSSGVACIPLVKSGADAAKQAPSNGSPGVEEPPSSTPTPTPAPTPTPTPTPTPVPTPSSGTHTVNRSSGHTASRLSDGKVLIVGGMGQSSIHSSAELFNPITGTTINTGSMARVRAYHSASVLQDGRVLIVGGQSNNYGPTGSAEIYSPAGGVFVSTGSLIKARFEHTSTVLQNGKVLIVGGWEDGPGYDPGTGNFIDTQLLSSAELYDPETGIFSSVGSMSVGRVNHTATLLPNGKVLITGGKMNLRSQVDVGTASAELFDPVSGTFSPLLSMLSARCRHQAVLLPDGRVLVAGGTFLNSAELYDPGMEGFVLTGSLSASRHGFTVELLPNGRVLIVGGVSGSGQLASTEVYDPSIGTFGTGPMMQKTRAFHASSILANGGVLIRVGSDWEFLPY